MDELLFSLIKFCKRIIAAHRNNRWMDGPTGRQTDRMVENANTSTNIIITLEGSNRGSYMSAHVLLNLLNELGKRDKNARLAEHFISFS